MQIHSCLLLIGETNMNYQDKTREELIQELQALQQQNKSLKSSFEKDIIVHKKVVKKLEESRDLFSNLACLVPGVIYQYRLFPDGHSSFPYASPGMNEIYEVTPEEVQEDTSCIFDRFHPDDFQHVKETIAESARTLDIFYCEYRVILPIQGLRWRWSQAYPERLPDGSILWHGIVLDTTERKQAEEKLQQIVDELKRSQRMAQVGNWKQDLITGIYTSSDELLRIFGFPIGSYLKIQNVSDCIHPDDLDRVMNKRKELLQSKESYTIEFRIITKDTGQVKNLKSVGEVQCDVDGTPIALIGTIQDVSQNKKTEEVQKQLKLLSRAIEHTPVSVVITDKNGNIEYVNPKFSTLTGYTIDEVKGKNPRVLQSGKHPISFYKELWETILSGKEWKGEFYNKKKNGELYIESAIISPILDRHGEITYIVAVKEDITEKKIMLEDLIKAKEKAEENDLLKTAFLNNISHEIRTPFNGMLGYLSILQHDELSQKEKDEFICIINNSAYRLMNTINDIVEISEIQSGQMKLVNQDIAIKNIAEEQFIRFKSEAERKGITYLLTFDLPDGLDYISTDGSKLKTIISNLIDNALKFTTFGSVEFNISKTGDFIKFKIIDTGIGIPENKKPTIFDRFIQVDASKTRLFEGLGLGLSISKAYVEMMDGEIWVESEVDKGSTFCFTIPHKSSSKGKTVKINITEPNNSEPKLKGLRILIAEDDETSLELLLHNVKSIAIEILIVRNGVDAIKTCHNNPDIDLILMDIKMPGMDGHEATRQIRKFNQDVVIIAQTAFAFIGDREEAITAGCNDYISKPLNKNTLMELIKKHF